ncbi:Sporulation related domain-containing protein [Palleronia marisminoris]|uniref:Sporulation related domain protein n=1 Tax=Palleronia marisminoris TaxID=315423 RepID=A0A1Y5TBV6_9RHOB|nr:SPOR domain-containing protein [Palleronia marisminoris]SFH23602.1 Sporulation related domain-containing protein [Palleronia marisminoris]SLN58478.1 Sporulation related domain protein [Palleronia marisminoris]
MTDYVYDEPAELELPEGRGAKAQRLVNAAGAMVSLGLVAGMCVWGYQLLVRDVSGVPVIEALEGAFRVAPEDPGGMTAPHQGLQVNEIAAVGSASGPVDQVRLAPGAEPLSDEDRAWGELLETPAEEAEDVLVDAGEGAVTTEMALLDEAGTPSPTMGSNDDEAAAEVIEDRPEDADPVELAIAEALAGPDVNETDSLRPQLRPEGVPAMQIASVEPVRATMTMATSNQEVDLANLPKGTRLVQLGAFASPEVARGEWDKLTGRFGEFFGDKRMVVQEAISGGKTFFRLRAEGFEDLADARRFCSALTAQRADCIPVEVR